MDILDTIVKNLISYAKPIYIFKENYFYSSHLRNIHLIINIIATATTMFLKEIYLRVLNNWYFVSKKEAVKLVLF